MKNSLEIINNSIRNYTERNGKHLLFKIAERGETFKIHSFEEKERINFENDSKFIIPVFNYTTNCIDTRYVNNGGNNFKSFFSIISTTSPITSEP